MAQYGRPDSDVATGSWTTAPLYQKIDEVTPSDTDYITQPTSGGTAEVGLGDVTDPSSNSTHVIRVRARYALQNPSFTFKLMDGSTTIKSQVITLTTTPTTYQYTLTSTEADNITDYTDLRFQLVAGSVFAGGAFVSWAEFECPDAGGTDITDDQDAYLDGQDTSIDDQDAYLDGQDTDVDNQIAYLDGSTDIADNTIAYARGSIDVVDNQIAFLHGGIAVEDSQEAYTEGSVGADTTDNTPAYAEGYEGSLSDSEGFTEGKSWWPLEDDYDGADADDWDITKWYTWEHDG